MPRYFLWLENVVILNYNECKLLILNGHLTLPIKTTQSKILETLTRGRHIDKFTPTNKKKNYTRLSVWLIWVLVFTSFWEGIIVKNCNLLFFLIFFIYLWENVRCYKGEHVFPNGTISLTLVSIFILKKK